MKTQTIHSLAITCLIVLPAFGQAQYQSPPGYYHPQYPQYPQQQPRQQQPRRQHSPSHQPHQQPQHEYPTQRKKPKAPPRDNSADKIPSADISTVTGPFTSYTWDFTDTLADLGRATGITPNQILALNNLSMSQLRDGQVLKIPEMTSTEISSLDLKPDESQQMAREVWRGVRGKKRIALTFDAGGDRDHGEQLLENLKSHEVPATFFVAGEFATKHSDLLTKIAAAGYPVHNHSWSHPDFTKVSNEDIAKELSRADDAISSVTQKSTKPYWRPPFGERDSRVLETTAHEGYKSMYWTIDSLDSVDEPKDATFVIDRILSPARAKANPDGFLDGAIVLMHVGKKGTAEAIPELVTKLRDRGFTLVTVDEILKP